MEMQPDGAAPDWTALSRLPRHQPESITFGSVEEPDSVCAAVLRESGGPTGNVLARTLEAVHEWVRSAEGTAGPLDPTALEALSLRPVARYLRLLHSELREVESVLPRSERLEGIAYACTQISRWAEGRGALRTALAYAEAALAACPEEPRYTYRIGKLARKCGHHQGSWEWLRWTLGLARARDDQDTFTLSLGALGDMFRADGQYFSAKRYYRACLHHARLLGMAHSERDALLSLAGLELERGGDVRVGVSYGQAALALCAPGDWRVAALARDMAWFLVDEYGLYEPALLVLDGLLRQRWSAADRLFLHGVRARAAAGAREHGAFEESWKEAMSGGMQCSPRVYGLVLIQLFFAAALLSEWARAMHAVRLAGLITAEHPNSRAAADAAEIFRLLSEHEGREARLREGFPQSETSAPEREAAEGFCLALAEILGERGRADLVSPVENLLAR